MDNPITQAMLNRKSIRHYKDKMPSDKIVKAIVRAGQQAPFAAQLGSLLLSRKKKHPWGAPIMFTLCVDAHKLELIMARRGWQMVSNDLWVLLLGIQDATLMAENMVIAAESCGLASCFLGSAPYRAEKIIKEYKLPPRVFPVVQLVMGYPAQDPPPRPRYPLDFVLFEDKYPQFDEETISQAMAAMDEGYLTQDYYRKLKAKIPLEGDRQETFTYENYSWTEHMSRKWGQWASSLDELLEQFSKCGFYISSTTKKE